MAEIPKPEVPAKPKRPYVKPTVTPLGTLINLTKGGGENTAPDGGAST